MSKHTKIVHYKPNMDQVTKIYCPFSKKNIPIPSEKEYLKKCFKAIGSLCSRMAWFAAIEMGKEDSEEEAEEVEYYGFKSHRAPPQEGVAVIKPFMDKLVTLFSNLKFRRNHNNKFQEELESWLSEVTSEKKVIIPADKTRNMYQMAPKDYNKLLTENITKEYKKADTVESGLVNKGNIKAKKWVMDIGKEGPELCKRMEIHTQENAFVTLKDHKEEFRTKKSLPCRLIKPSKCDLGRISKKRLETITQIIRSETKTNQWKSVIETKNWFNGIRNKKKVKFLIFDIVGFYPAITPELLSEAIQWAKHYTTITPKDEILFQEARRSFLFNNDTAYVKRNNPHFDVGMGSYDGAEACEIVGLFLLEKVFSAKIGIRRECTGLYRDDGICVVRDQVKIDTLVKKLRNIFKRYNLELDIKHSLVSADYLDITMNLGTGEYEPYQKPDNEPIYVNKGSNHPPCIVENLPRMIHKMVSDNSSNEKVFNKHKRYYSEALRRSGYSGHMEYVPPKASKGRKRARWGRIFYFNPAFNMMVKTKVGRKFIDILMECFPKGHPWHKFFNRHTVKLSYSCTRNVASRISAHNAKVLRGKAGSNGGCNCKNKSECPMENNCLTSSVIYQALIESSEGWFNYFGMTEYPFKTRYNQHMYDFRTPGANGTTLSNKIWDLKNRNKEYKVTWSIVDRAYTYSAGGKSCDLCTSEKMHIALGRKGFKKLPEGCELLNKRSELMSKCRHQAKFTLKRVKEDEEEEDENT